jgi:23S rRNA (guanine745-N1)-methyltransferase
VRGCAQPLRREDGRARCPAGHSFDYAKSGYLNLLQPQDRRSATPGDSRSAAAARRRLYDAGHGAPLVAELQRQLSALELPPVPALLDVGCGEGSLLAALAAARPLAAHGLDISTPAIELAARRWPAIGWVIANADRFLPYAAGSFDVALSLSSRVNAAELARAVKPGGRAIVAVPAADDLIELRAALLGEGVQRERLERSLAALAPHFELEERAQVRHCASLDGGGVRDVLAATYRGARLSQQERLAELGAMRVTMSFDLARLRRRAAAPA